MKTPTDFADEADRERGFNQRNVSHLFVKELGGWECETGKELFSRARVNFWPTINSALALADEIVASCI